VSAKPPPIVNRVTELLGVDYPIVQAPMGYIARAQLASAVSNAGGLGIIETSSGATEACQLEINTPAASRISRIDIHANERVNKKPNFGTARSKKPSGSMTLSLR